MSSAFCDALPVSGGAGRKLAFVRHALRILSHRQQARAFHHGCPDGSNGGGRHCIVLHGWALNEADMREMLLALQAVPGCAGRCFWTVRYDTQWTSFEISAQRLAAELQRQCRQFEDVVFVAYSMGGIVARRMIADGFGCRALLAICAPHHGPLPWLSFPGPGSLRRNRPAMCALEANSRDRAHRNRYHLFGITYRDLCGEHCHDGVVPLQSALGADLGAVAARHTTCLRYKGIAIYDAHWRGKSPHYMPAVLQAMEAIEAAGAPPVPPGALPQTDGCD